MPTKTVLALSGGLDSVVLAYDMARRKQSFHAVTTRLGAPNSDREVMSAKYFASNLNINLEVTEALGIGEMVSTFGVVGALDGGDSQDHSGGGEADIKGIGQNRNITGFYANVAIMAFYARLIGATSAQAA